MNRIVFTLPKGGAKHPEEVMITLNGEPLGYVEEVDMSLSMDSIKPIVTLTIQADVEFVEIEAHDENRDDTCDDTDPCVDPISAGSKS